MRAVVLDEAGRPKLAEVPEPKGEGKLLRVLACGLCGSDVEKLGEAPKGTMLGHEVAAELPDRRRVALVHHLPCGKCERCRAGHESTCEEFAAATIRPGGLAEKARAGKRIEIPTPIPDATAPFAEPLACVLRALERCRGAACSSSAAGSSAISSPRRSDGGVTTSAASRRRCTSWPRAARCSSSPEAGRPTLDAVYRRELSVVGCRSGTVNLLPDIDPLPTTVLPLARFAEGLEAYRSGEALKVAFTP